MVYDIDMNKKEIAEKILKTLERQKFADWYRDGDFDRYISGDLYGPTKEEILEKIEKMFDL